MPALRRRPYATREPRSRTTRAERESGCFHAQRDQYPRAMSETSSDLAHLRLERPSEGVALLTLDNPEMRNAMSDEMTASWVAAIDELAADTSVRAVVVTGEGSAFCSGGNTSWIASEPDASVDRLRVADAAVLPGVAVDPAPRGAHHRRRQRRRDRGRPLPRARLRHPLRRGRRQARRALQQARHARRHGRHLAAAQRGRSRPRARPAPHRPRRGGRRGAAARPGLARHRARRRSSTRCSRRRPASRPPPRSRRA